MDLQFQFPLLFRFVITSTITMIIERKHQVQSNSIKFNQVSETLRGGRNHTQTAWADQIPDRSWPWVSRLPPALPGACEPCSRGLLTVALVAA